MRSLRFVLVLFLLASPGCSGDFSSPAPAAQPPAGEAPDPAPRGGLTGVWSGDFDGRVVYLSLESSGNLLEGSGALFEEGDPVTLDVSGTANSQGEAIIDLVPADEDDDLESLRLSLAFQADQAVGTGTDQAHPEGSPVTLARLAPEQALGLEAYRVAGTAAGVAYDFEVALLASDRDQLVGNWRSTHGALVLDRFAGGRVSAGLDASGDWVRITLEDEFSLLQLAELWFRRDDQGLAGVSQALDSDSRLLTGSHGFDAFSGTVVRLAAAPPALAASFPPPPTPSPDRSGAWSGQDLEMRLTQNGPMIRGYVLFRDIVFTLSGQDNPNQLCLLEGIAEDESGFDLLTFSLQFDADDRARVDVSGQDGSLGQFILERNQPDQARLWDNLLEVPRRLNRPEVYELASGSGNLGLRADFRFIADLATTGLWHPLDFFDGPGLQGEDSGRCEGGALGLDTSVVIFRDGSGERDFAMIRFPRIKSGQRLDSSPFEIVLPATGLPFRHKTGPVQAVKEGVATLIDPGS